MWRTLLLLIASVWMPLSVSILMTIVVHRRDVANIRLLPIWTALSIAVIPPILWMDVNRALLHLIPLRLLASSLVKWKRFVATHSMWLVQPVSLMAMDSAFWIRIGSSKAFVPTVWWAIVSILSRCLQLCAQECRSIATTTKSLNGFSQNLVLRVRYQ